MKKKIGYRQDGTSYYMQSNLAFNKLPRYDESIIQGQTTQGQTTISAVLPEPTFTLQPVPAFEGAKL